ncbi:hypothetical protein RO3G_07269 [Rhizopus delemar RA 99-880]|uniref:Uncharacterized protein n=1 Tax=Rhizopus delemar (strain RA 99-880 / ATCC MYA-4621 / FGSC 9543 / NRRL 43880) TaxID=246409 RepID=I1C284_RHIO9|nr:hypothetical protein RO3G_07269 [Rhizopus delemar RA 99-880]|eukprot:EIE82564.1 hypothetical protein RO3G_07269 [Rhizopus delemar RA 99-880]
MSSSNFNLPENLNVKVGSPETSKNKAHLAYYDDIKKLQEGVKMNSNKWQTLEACKVALQQNAHKNHANKFFWENDAKRVVEIASSGLAIDEELLQLEKVTAITALKSFNGTVNANREENERNTSSKRQDSNPEKPSFKQLFESFQRQALSQASVNDGLCLETHMYELL